MGWFLCYNDAFMPPVFSIVAVFSPERNMSSCPTRRIVTRVLLDVHKIQTESYHRVVFCDVLVVNSMNSGTWGGSYGADRKALLPTGLVPPTIETCFRHLQSDIQFSWLANAGSVVVCRRTFDKHVVFESKQILHA